MTKATDYLENAVLNHVLRGNYGATFMDQPANVYLALHEADPTEDATGAELTGGTYERQIIDFNEPALGVTTNSSLIVFTGLPTGTVAYLGIWDALENGNLLFYSDQLDNVILLNTDDGIEIAAEALTVSLD